MEISLAHPMFFLKKQMEEICKPLYNNTPFTYFDYARYTFDGYYLSLSADPEFGYQMFKHDLHPNLDELHKHQTHHAFLSSSLPLPEAALDTNKYLQNIVLAKNCNIFHRTLLAFQNETNIEFFIFGFYKNIKYELETSLDYTPLLNKFCVYFHQAAAPLINDLSKEKVLFDTSIDKKYFENLLAKKQHCYQKLFIDMKLNEYTLEGKNGKCTLNSREFDCLFWLSKSRSVKQTARILSLSPRTVEDYLANLKNKLGCVSRFELIDIYSTNAIIRELSDMVD